MRATRVSVALVALGTILLLLALPLWNFTRWDSSGCEAHQAFPCDPRIYSPFAPLALGLAVTGIAAFVAVIIILLALGFRCVRALDAQEREARRASAEADA
jgi:Sec-independent protein secretion pathway component TatC